MKIDLREPFAHLYEEVSLALGQGNVFMVGGFVRDTLLGRMTGDLDLCCSNSPLEVKAAFPKGLFFSRFGTCTFHSEGVEITIACLRQETDYQDFRHPGQVTFVKTIAEDYLRRDFTVNCLYVNDRREILDPTGMGLLDLKEKKIRLIGEKDLRLKEDPLRILRAYRFALELGFALEKETAQALKANESLIHKLNPQKIKEEIRKCPKDKQKEMLACLGIEESVV